MSSSPVSGPNTMYLKDPLINPIINGNHGLVAGQRAPLPKRILYLPTRMVVALPLSNAALARMRLSYT